MKSNEKFTARAERAIELARTAAGELGHSFVGTEHLLLGILADGHLTDAGGRRVDFRNTRKGCSEQYGARPLRRCIQRYLEDAAAELLPEGRAAPGGRIRVRTEGDELRLTVEHSDIA